MKQIKGWVYGLVEEGGELKLSEVYLAKSMKNNGYGLVSWEDIDKDNFDLIIADITAQLKGIYLNKKRKYKFKIR